MKEVNLFNRKVFIKDVVIMLLIIALPFLFYLYRLIPEVKVWETKYFTYDSVYFEDVSVLVWTLLTKILTLLFLSLWFMTCKHWWRHTILIPIIIECYKITGILNQDYYYVDDQEFILSLPLTIPVLFILILLTKKLNYFSQSVNISTELDREINNLLNELSVFKEENFKSLKRNLKELRQKKESIDAEDYLRKLVALRENLTKL